MRDWDESMRDQVTNQPSTARLTMADIQPCGACPVRGLAVCGVLDPDELYAVAEVVQELHRTHRQSVIIQGDEAHDFFIVTGGVASVDKLLADGRRQVIGFLYPSDFFGLAIDGQYAYNVTALAPLSLCRFERSKYLALVARFPNLESRLLGMASDELAASQEHVVVLGCKTAREKVASFLCMLSDRSYRLGRAWSPIWVPMKRDDIAAYLGLTTETTSRMFTQLKKEGLVKSLPNSMIDLPDITALKKVANAG
jgi:CRP/FNR family transcriptional regulator